MGELDELSMGCFSPSKYLTLQLTILRSLQSSTTMSSSQEMSSLSSVSTRTRLARNQVALVEDGCQNAQADLALCLGIRQSQARRATWEPLAERRWVTVVQRYSLFEMSLLVILCQSTRGKCIEP